MNKNYFAHLLAIIALLFSNLLVAQDSGIFESYVIFNSSETLTGDQFYDVDATTASLGFDGFDPGTNNASNSRIFKGGQHKTFKQTTATEATGVQYVSQEVQEFNTPDENINLALLDDATLSGSVSGGRGPIEAILYDPSIDDYTIRTDWNEYGVELGENIGRPDVDNGFLWQVDWSTPKAINYITFGGSYANQPQSNALWRISYLSNNDWVTLEEGQGGWIDRSVYEWDGTAEPPITADALRVQIYSDGETDLVSIHLRGRGGLSNNTDDRAIVKKATLIQYLPQREPIDNTPNKNINLALLDDATLSGSVSDGRGPIDAILYDPSIDDYFIRTVWNEYGVNRDENLGRPDADNAFFWQVDWAAPKVFNYITFGGSYPNQPQPDALWRISYLSNNDWVTLEEGQGGWIDQGIYEWDGITEPAITADAVRVQIYSDGDTDLVSILIRGRGGLSLLIDDRTTATKATLIQYLETSPSLSIPEIESQAINKMRVFPNPSSGEAYVSFEVTTGIKAIEIIDLAGRLVQHIKGGNIDKEGELIYIRALPDGVYILSAIDTSGIRYQEKLIINRN